MAEIYFNNVRKELGAELFDKLHPELTLFDSTLWFGCRTKFSFPKHVHKWRKRVLKKPSKNNISQFLKRTRKHMDADVFLALNVLELDKVLSVLKTYFQHGGGENMPPNMSAPLSGRTHPPEKGQVRDLSNNVLYWHIFNPFRFFIEKNWNEGGNFGLGMFRAGVVSAIFSSAVDILSAEELRALNATKGPHGEFIQIIQFIFSRCKLWKSTLGKRLEKLPEFCVFIDKFPFFYDVLKESHDHSWSGIPKNNHKNHMKRMLKCFECGEREFNHDDIKLLQCTGFCSKTNFKAYYCGKKCQRKHWKSTHKYKCHEIAKV